MTARAPKTVDGSLISKADLERMRHEEEQHARAMRNAAVTVAARSHDLADARMLFDLLGLDASVLSEARGELRARTATVTAKTVAKPVKRARKKTAA